MKKNRIKRVLAGMLSAFLAVETDMKRQTDINKNATILTGNVKGSSVFRTNDTATRQIPPIITIMAARVRETAVNFVSSPRFFACWMSHG